MKIFTKSLFLALNFLMAGLLFAQSFTVTPSPASCPGNGSAIVATSGVTNALFQLKNAAGNNMGVAVTSGSFTSLDAGNYQMQVTGEGNYSETQNFTIANTYKPIPTPTITISGLCNNTFTLGGTLSVSVPAVAGKTFQYKVVKTTDPNFDDNTGTYVSLGTVTNITSFGAYQVRIKDECGQIITITRNILPTLPALASMTFNLSNNQSCSSNSVGMTGINFYTANGSVVSMSEYAAAGGVKVEMWENTGGGCPGTVPASAPVFSQVITSQSGYVLPIVATKRYVVRLTSPCGEVRIACNDINAGTIRSFQVATTNSGCDALETMKIKGSSNSFWKMPVNVRITNSGGTEVYTYRALTETQLDTWVTANLPLGNYTVTYTDECVPANSMTKAVANPKPATPAAPTLSIAYTKYRCFDDNSGSLTLTGATQIALTINGYIPNRENAVVTIIEGPSNLNVPAKIHNNTLFVWTNVIPGPYKIRFNTGCSGTPIEMSFNVNPPESQILNQSLVSIGKSECGGTGSITSTILYTGPFGNVVELLNNAGVIIAESSAGTFTNLGPGTYTTRLRVSTCTSDKYYVDNANPIVIADPLAGPQIIKKVGIVCEDSSGTPTSTGSAYFEVAGASPLKVEYKLASEPDSALQLFSNDSPSTFEIAGLIPNETYEILLTSCGNTTRTRVIIQTPGAMNATNTVQPCVNNPYTLSMPEYAGATYVWKNPAGTIISNSRTYTFTNYMAANDGEYSGTITWGGCVVRYVKVTLNSKLCGGPIGSCGTIDSDGDGIFDGCDLDDDNDGILDTAECSNTIEDMFAMYSSNGLVNILPVDFGLVTNDKHKNVSRDLSHKFGYPPNSGAIIVTITNGSVHPDPATPVWWTKDGEQPSNWTITGTMSAFVLMAQDLNYYANDSKTFHIYDQAPVIPVTFPAVLANQTPVPNQWAVTETPTAKTLTNLRSDNPTVQKPANWRYVNMNFGPKSFGFSTTVAQADPTYVVLVYLECDTDKDGIPNRLDLDSDNDGCIDAIEGGGTVSSSQVTTASGTVSTGFGSPAANQNLGITVDGNGIPTIINGGQTVGDSQNSLVNGCVCYEPATTLGTTLPTQHGITALGRGSEKITDWPQVRKGAWTVLESKTKGFVINRISTSALVQAIPNPVIGMMVYDEQARCLKINTTGTPAGWSCFNTQTCP